MEEELNPGDPDVVGNIGILARPTPVAGLLEVIEERLGRRPLHVAREEGIEFIAAGHHATERYGVQSLGAELALRLDLEHRFIDVDNPV